MTVEPPAPTPAELGYSNEAIADLSIRWVNEDATGYDTWQLHGIDLGARGSGPAGLNRLLTELVNAVIREHNGRPLTPSHQPPPQPFRLF